jgi:hypothetical protein
VPARVRQERTPERGYDSALVTTHWQERITVGTDPSVRTEHTLRYEVAAPVVGQAATWCDLGCGTGLAAGSATDGSFAGELVLVDVDAPSVAQAAAHLRADAITPLVADLNDAAGRAAVRAAVLAAPAPRALTSTCATSPPSSSCSWSWPSSTRRRSC